MSYLSNALIRMSEKHGLLQADIVRRSKLSSSHISRAFKGESHTLADHHFAAVLDVFAADVQAQAELVAARCRDARAGVETNPGAALVEISIKGRTAAKPAVQPDIPHVELSHATERAFAYLRSQCPVNPDLEQHLVLYAKLLGQK
jgi:transcriptional regulator with XRE-family HTH domain